MNGTAEGSVVATLATVHLPWQLSPTERFAQAQATVIPLRQGKLRQDAPVAAGTAS